MATVCLDYDLDSLVRGKENLLAISGVLKVVAEPGERYNPLFLHGPPSSGKTHLLYALRRRLEEDNPDWNLLALPAGEFLEECENAWQNNASFELRQDFWRLNALLIDDVHLLVKRPAAQEELYHAFNRLIADGKQLVLTSRYPPAELTDFPLALRTRFQSGLVVGVESPREQLLGDILQRRCDLSGVRLTREAAGFLAKELRSVRELHGVVTQLEQSVTHDLRGLRNGNGKLDGHRYSLDEVKEVLDKHTAERLTVADIAKSVCQYLHVDLSKVRSSSRQQALVQARQLAMYLAREMTTAPLTEIGEFFGGRDHTTVLYAYRKIAEETHMSPFTARACQEIRGLLRGG